MLSLYKFFHRQNSTIVLEVRIVITPGKAMTGREQRGVLVVLVRWVCSLCEIHQAVDLGNVHDFIYIFVLVAMLCNKLSSIKQQLFYYVHRFWEFNQDTARMVYLSSVMPGASYRTLECLVGRIIWGFFTHMSNAWARTTQRLSSAVTVKHSLEIWPFLMGLGFSQCGSQLPRRNILTGGFHIRSIPDRIKRRKLYDPLWSSLRSHTSFLLYSIGWQSQGKNVKEFVPVFF